MTTVLAPAPAADHRGQDDLPWVDFGNGVEIKVLQVDLLAGLWVVQNRFAPGAAVQTHQHTGPVYAFTETGSWKYSEYPDVVNRAGSYLFEPANSTHTLVVDAANTEPTLVWFAIHGANLNLREDGSVERVVDAQRVLDAYKAGAVAAGHPEPDVIGDPTSRSAARVR